MPCIEYVPKRFRPQSMLLIAEADQILTEYAEQGYTLTLRQLYYQFVSRNLLRNTERCYKRLGGIMSDARLAGLIDWSCMVDRTRALVANAHWTSPQQIVEACASEYMVDRWEHQPERVEVWVEKDALLGVVARAVEELDVPYFSCRGYTSQSEMWTAGRRLVAYLGDGQLPVILHLGDHDPSGLDMTRDIAERLEIFVQESEGEGFVLERIALSMDQIDEYGLPPNPVKVADSRATVYVDEFGDDSWELDALSPHLIVDLVQSAVSAHIDPIAWDAALHEEYEGQALLREIAASTRRTE